jgi:hypothetical protein
MDKYLTEIQEGYESIVTGREADAERAGWFAAFCVMALSSTLVCAMVALIAQALLGG